MAIRRRRKTLSNLLSTMERRVTSVELRPINLLTGAEISAALAGEDDILDEGPDSVAGLDAPNQYKAITEGFFYSAGITGSQSRVEFYFDADPGLSKDETIRVSGVHKMRHSNAPVDLTVSGEHRVISSDTPPYTGRVTYDGKRDIPEETVGATVLFNPKVATNYEQPKTIFVKSRIASVSATTTTATVTFTAAHYFQDNDVVFVGMPTDSPFYGLDGLYRIKDTTDTTITYDFSSALDEPINSSSITEERYVHAVAQSKIRDGATFVDASTDPDTVYVWKDIRWVLFTSTTVPRDKKPPGRVTDLDAEDEVDTPSGSVEPRSRVTLTWVAPTANEDGSALDDLAGYTVWWKFNNDQEWEKADFTGLETTWSHTGFPQGRNAYFRVFARDTGGNLSVGVSKIHFVGVTVPTVQKPKVPTVTTYLGTIKVSYDDLTDSGLVQAGTAKEIEVYFSDIAGFTAGPTSFYGKFPANAGSYLIIPGTELVDNTDYYIRLIVRDIFGNISEASDPPIAIRARLSNIVTFDMIDVGTLVGQVIIGADIRTASAPFNTGGIILNADGLVAYNDTGGQTFRIDAQNGGVSIGAYLGRDEAANFLTVADADSKYSTTIRADGISIVANAANALATDAKNTADGASAVAVQASTDIAAGRITIIGGDVVKSLNALKNKLPNNTTEIHGDVISTGTILADRIGTGRFPVGVVYAGEISAGQITAGVIEGRTVRTGPVGGKRVTLNNSQNAIQFHNSSNVLMGQIDGQTTSGGVLEISGPGDPSITIGVANTTITRGLLVGGNTTVTSGRLGQVLFSAAGGTTAAVHRSSGGENVFLFGPAGSDERLKKDIVELENSLELINNLRPVKFRFKSEEDGPVSYGLIAQEVQPFFDDNDNVVNSYEAGESDEDKEEYLTVEYNAFIAPLIGAIKELTQRNLDLEARVASLEESSK